MNKKIAKMAESLDVLHIYIHTTIIYQIYLSNETQYKEETCRKMQVKFDMRKNMKLE